MTGRWQSTRAKSDDPEIESELAAYVEERTAQGVAAGLDPEEAGRRARVEVGGVAAMAGKLREQRAEAAPGRWLREFGRDVRHVWRQCCRAGFDSGDNCPRDLPKLAAQRP